MLSAVRKLHLIFCHLKDPSLQSKTLQYLTEGWSSITENLLILWFFVLSLFQTHDDLVCEINNIDVHDFTKLPWLIMVCSSDHIVVQVSKYTLTKFFLLNERIDSKVSHSILHIPWIGNAYSWRFYKIFSLKDITSL